MSADCTLAVATLVLAHDVIDLLLDRTTSVFTLFISESVYTCPLLISTPFIWQKIYFTPYEALLALVIPP